MDQRKRMKKNAACWALLVDFVEEHPEMVTHSFVGVDARKNYRKLWDEVTKRLNDLGQGTKTSDEWIEAFTKWKSKVKGKAQDISCGMKKTGGGRPLPASTPVEERLMAIVGWKCVTGDETPELGLGSIIVMDSNIPVEEITVVDNVGAKENTGMPSMASCSRIPESDEIIKQSEHQREVKRKPESQITNIRKSRRLNKPPDSVTLTTVHNDTMSILKEINSNVARLADSHEQHNKILKDFFYLYTHQQSSNDHEYL